MMHENLIFLHIPKAAGSTLHPILERHYAKSQTRTISLPSQLESFKREPAYARNEVRLLKGHMPFGLHEYLAGHSSYITLLRHPVDRIISYYYYVKRQPAHYLHQATLNGISLADFIGSGLSGELDNGQVRLLSGHDQDIPFGQCSANLLEIAKANLESYFTTVGLTESFNESLILMSLKLGWKWIPYYIVRNVTQGRPPLAQLDSETAEMIQKTNSLDLLLYEWSEKRFRTELSRYEPQIATGLATLDRANRLYKPWGQINESLRKLLRSRLMVRSSLGSDLRPE